MATNGNKISFVKGQICHVFKDTGVRDLKGGPSTSERTGGDYEDITPSEDLLVVEKFGSTRARVKRMDGSMVLIHINHINPGASYYASRGAPKKEMSPTERVAAAKAQMAKLKAELDAAQKAEAEAEEEFSTEFEGAREEAQQLFAQNS